MQTPRAPRPNPFAGVAPLDFVRDGVAALALIASLFMRWNLTSKGYQHIDVDLLTLLSLLSLSLLYLGRLGVLPRTWTPATVRFIRLLPGAAYTLMVLFYLVVDVVVDSEPGASDPFWLGTPSGSTYLGGGLGPGLAIGFAAAVLAATPRLAELPDAEGRAGQAKLWKGICTAFLGLAGLVALLQLIYLFVDLGDVFTSIGAVRLVLLVVLFLTGVALVIVPLVGLQRRQQAWRRVLIGLGMIGVLAVIVSNGFLSGMTAVSSIHPVLVALSLITLVFGGGGILLPFFAWSFVLLAAAAAASSPATLMAMRRGADQVAEWFETITRALQLAAGYFAVAAVVGLLVVIDGTFTGPGLVTAIFAVLFVAICVVALLALKASRVQGRLVTLVAAGAFGLLGLVQLIIRQVTVNSSGISGVDAFALVAPLAFGVLLAAALLMPASMRAFAAAHPRPAPGAPWPTAPGAQPAPVPPTAMSTTPVPPTAIPGQAAPAVPAGPTLEAYAPQAAAVPPQGAPVAPAAIAVPQVAQPQLAVPDAVAPEAAVSGTAAPVDDVPDWAGPDLAVPDVAVPHSTVPGTAASAADIAEAPEPAIETPEVAMPQPQALADAPARGGFPVVNSLELGGEPTQLDTEEVTGLSPSGQAAAMTDPAERPQLPPTQGLPIESVPAESDPAGSVPTAAVSPEAEAAPRPLPTDLPVFPPATTPSGAPGGHGPSGSTEVLPAVTPPAAPVTEGSWYTAGQAANPATDPMVLAEIARTRPDLRLLVASNPNTPQPVVDALDAMRDPEISAAIRARGPRS